jgi:hypothetical protein
MHPRAVLGEHRGGACERDHCDTGEQQFLHGNLRFEREVKMRIDAYSFNLRFRHVISGCDFRMYFPDIA